MLPLFKLFGTLSVLLLSCASHSISLAAPLGPGSTNSVQIFDDTRLQTNEGVLSNTLHRNPQALYLSKNPKHIHHDEIHPVLRRAMDRKQIRKWRYFADMARHDEGKWEKLEEEARKKRKEEDRKHHPPPTPPRRNSAPH